MREQLRRRGTPRGAVDAMEWAFLVNLESFVRGHALGFDCQALESSCFVSADGMLYPCHVWDRPLADLRQADFRIDRVWADEATKRTRGEIEKLACGGCFTPCEAYPGIAGSPVRAGGRTLARLAQLAWKSARAPALDGAERA